MTSFALGARSLVYPPPQPAFHPLFLLGSLLRTISSQVFPWVNSFNFCGCQARQSPPLPPLSLSLSLSLLSLSCLSCPCNPRHEPRPRITFEPGGGFQSSLVLSALNFDSGAGAPVERLMARLGCPASDSADSLIRSLLPVDRAEMVESAETVDPVELDVWERPSETGQGRPQRTRGIRVRVR